MFERFRKWLRGEFRCRRCGEVWYGYHFGFGEMICPRCFRLGDGGKWLFPDMRYWLNRLLFRGSLNA